MIVQNNSGDLNTGHPRSKKFGVCFSNDPTTVGIWNPTFGNPDFLKIRFQRVRLSIAMVPNILKTGIFETWTFLFQFQMFLDKMVAFCPDFIHHLKSGPFATQPFFDHLKSRLVWILDPHCVWKPNILVWYLVYSCIFGCFKAMARKPDHCVWRLDGRIQLRLFKGDKCLVFRCN